MDIKYFLSVLVLLLLPINVYSNDGLESNHKKHNEIKQDDLKRFGKCQKSIVLDDTGRQITLTGNVVIQGASLGDRNIFTNDISKCLKFDKKNEAWIQIEAMHGDKKSPVIGAPYTIFFSDQRIIEGKLDDKGQVLQKQIPTTVVGLFIGEDQREWQPYVKQ